MSRTIPEALSKDLIAKYRRDPRPDGEACLQEILAEAYSRGGDGLARAAPPPGTGAWTLELYDLRRELIRLEEAKASEARVDHLKARLENLERLLGVHGTTGMERSTSTVIDALAQNIERLANSLADRIKELVAHMKRLERLESGIKQTDEAVGKIGWRLDVLEAKPAVAHSGPTIDVDQLAANLLMKQQEMGPLTTGSAERCAKVALALVEALHPKDGGA